MELSNIIEKIGKNRFLFTSSISPIITIFDHFRYSRNDYDHLSPKQRQYIAAIFTDNGLKQTSGSEFTFENKKIGIHKAPGLGVSPLDGLLRALNQYDYVVTSPMSCFLYYIYKNIAQDEVYRLIEKCPVNLDQAFDFTYQQDYRDRLMVKLEEYKNFQHDNQESHQNKRIP
jgi:hypothetical protein